MIKITEELHQRTFIALENALDTTTNHLNDYISTQETRYSWLFGNHTRIKKKYETEIKELKSLISAFAMDVPVDDSEEHF